MNRFAALLAMLLFAGGSSHASDLDPAGLAESMPGASWKQVMKEFRKLDRDDDGLLSRGEREIEGEIHRGYRNLYHIPDEASESIPLKWITGVNFVWDDHVAIRPGVLRRIATWHSMPPGHRAAVIRTWLLWRGSF